MRRCSHPRWLHYLLFEIGRRLVNDEKVPADYRREKQGYDSLMTNKRGNHKLWNYLIWKTRMARKHPKSILCLVNPNWLTKTIDIGGLAPSLWLTQTPAIIVISIDCDIFNFHLSMKQLLMAWTLSQSLVADTWSVEMAIAWYRICKCVTH